MLKYERKTTLLKTCGPQIWLCLFTFPCITLKQINSLTTTNTCSWRDCRQVTYHTAMPEVPDLIPEILQGFLWFFLYCCCSDHIFLVQETLFHDMLPSLLQCCFIQCTKHTAKSEPFIRVSRYRHSIFNIHELSERIIGVVYYVKNVSNSTLHLEYRILGFYILSIVFE